MRIVSCTRLEAMTQLAELYEGAEHLDKDDLADEAFEAYWRVSRGADVVKVGHSEFRIREAQAS